MPLLAMDVATTASTGGDAIPVIGWDVNKSIQTTGTFTATLQLQGSLDGANWVQIGSNITGAGITAVTWMGGYLRIYTSLYTSGTPVITLAGMKPNGE